MQLHTNTMDGDHRNNRANVDHGPGGTASTGRTASTRTHGTHRAVNVPTKKHVPGHNNNDAPTPITTAVSADGNNTNATTA